MGISTGSATRSGWAAPSATPAGDVRCRCGHGLDMHEHFRSGTDCSACGAAECGRFGEYRAARFSLRTVRALAPRFS